MVCCNCWGVEDQCQSVVSPRWVLAGYLVPVEIDAPFLFGNGNVETLNSHWTCAVRQIVIIMEREFKTTWFTRHYHISNKTPPLCSQILASKWSRNFDVWTFQQHQEKYLYFLSGKQRVLILWGLLFRNSIDIKFCYLKLLETKSRDFSSGMKKCFGKIFDSSRIPKESVPQ